MRRIPNIKFFIDPFLPFLLLLLFVKSTVLEHISEEELICPDHTFFNDGSCSQVIDGCLRYDTSSKCLLCEEEYQIKEGNCTLIFTIDNSEFSINSALQTSSIKSSSSISQFHPLFQQQLQLIREKVSLNETTLAQSSYDLTTLNTIQVINGNFYLLEWKNSAEKIFMIEASVDLQNQVSILFIGQKQNMKESQINSFMSNILQSLKAKYPSKLSSTQLFKIEKVSGNLYRLHFMDQFGQQYLAFIQKSPFLEVKALETILFNLTPTFILDFVYFNHPSLARVNFKQVLERKQSSRRQFEVTFTSGTKVVVQVQDQKLKIIFFNIKENKTLSNSSSEGYGSLGGFQQFQFQEDEVFQRVIAQLFAEFDFLEGSEITKIDYQVIAGTNFLVTLVDPFTRDKYTCKIFYSLSGDINIIDVYLNQVLIHTRPLPPTEKKTSYNYLVDSVFLEIRQYLSLNEGIPLWKQVLFVNRKTKETPQKHKFYEYQIVFDEVNYVTVLYFEAQPEMQQGHIELYHFVQNGEFKLENLPSSVIQSEITSFLQSFQDWLRPLAIEYLKQTKINEYLCKIITGQGSYFFKLRRISRQGNQHFRIIYYQLIDERQFCLTNSPEELSQFALLQGPFFSSLLASYGLSNTSQIVSLTEAIQSEQVKVRLIVLDSESLLKIQIILRKRYGSYFPETIRPLNEGFHKLLDMDIYQSTLTEAYSSYYSELMGNNPVFVQTNSIDIKVYFASQTAYSQHLLLFTKNIITEQTTLQQIFEQNKQNGICQQLDKKGHCLTCQQNQTPFFQQCHSYIKGCSQQFGDQCLQCQKEYTKVGNQCIVECALLW